MRTSRASIASKTTHYAALTWAQKCVDLTLLLWAVWSVSVEVQGCSQLYPSKGSGRGAGCSSCRSRSSRHGPARSQQQRSGGSCCSWLAPAATGRVAGHVRTHAPQNTGTEYRHTAPHTKQTVTKAHTRPHTKHTKRCSALQRHGKFSRTWRDDSCCMCVCVCV